MSISVNFSRPLATVEIASFLDYLTPTELGLAERICHAWQSATKGCWKAHCTRQGIPIEVGFDPINRFKRTYPLLKLGRDFFPIYFGAEPAAVRPIPTAFFRRKQGTDLASSQQEAQNSDNFDLCYNDSSVTLTVGEDSPLYLDEKGRLKDDANRPVALRGQKRVLEISLTLHNIGILFKYPKKGNPIGYCSEVGTHKAAELADIPLEPSWSYHRYGAILGGVSFAEQRTIVAAKGLRVPTLLERTLYLFKSYVAYGAVRASGPMMTRLLSVQKLSTAKAILTSSLNRIFLSTIHAAIRPTSEFSFKGVLSNFAIYSIGNADDTLFSGCAVTSEGGEEEIRFPLTCGMDEACRGKLRIRESLLGQEPIAVAIPLLKE